MTPALDQVSDHDLDREYRRRFFLRAGVTVDHSQAAAQHFTALFAAEPDRECFALLYLNHQNGLLHSEILFKGSLSEAPVYPREIIKRAFQHQAAALICAHNHPSGLLHPSPDDREVTTRIRRACETVAITLHDHLIISGQGWFSFADEGLL
ncbi:MAG: RadC family protein [Fidelibacterota bacterium]